MCLALPAQIVSKDGDEAWVTMGDSRIRANLVMTPDAGIDDWVLVHAGFAIQHLTDEEALETFEMYRRMQEGDTR
jgi:hydrogenase expression/formation protein HypC